MGLEYKIMKLKCSCGVIIEKPYLDEQAVIDTVLICPFCGRGMEEVDIE